MTVGPAATVASRWLYVTPFAGQNEYNTAWWRAYWKRLPAEAVIIPTNGADLAAAARTDGLLVLARMDMGLLSTADAAAHPDWAAVDAQGTPIQLDGRVAACVNRGYFKQEAAQATSRLIRELGADGVLAVGWSGLDRTRICHCPDCARDFRASTGAALPETVDMDLPAYWIWADWNVKRRNEIWTTLDAAARQSGSTTYGWTGLTDADRLARTQKFQDVRAIAQIASILFVEDSAASAKGRFRLHLDGSRYLTTLLGSRPVIALNHTHHVAGRDFALTTDAAAEIRLRMMTGIAGGAGAAVALNADPTLDRRAAEIAPPVMAWQRTNAVALAGRSPFGRVGLVWSGPSADRYGRDESAVLSDAPYRGMVAALVRNHLSYQTIDAQDLTGDLSAFSLLILPNVAAMSDAESTAVRAFVRAGGALIATNETSLYDHSGAPRTDFALADVFGTHRPAGPVNRLLPITPIPGGGRGGGLTTAAVLPGATAGGAGTAPVAGAGAGTAAGAGRGGNAAAPGRGGGRGRGGGAGAGGPGALSGAAQHDYVRLHPQLAAIQAGPHPPVGGEPHEKGSRHAVLAGFDGTDLLPYGGTLAPLTVESDREVTMTFIPPFPSLPVDENYIREDRLDSPGLIVGSFGQGRVAFMPADFDRQLGLDPLVEHQALMTNVFKWALGTDVPLIITGRGAVATSLLRQNGKLVLHLVNLTGADNLASPVTDYTPVGPLKVSLRIPAASTGRITRLAASGPRPSGRLLGAGASRRLEFELANLIDHEAFIIE
jgi:hypothetical protein